MKVNNYWSPRIRPCRTPPSDGIKIGRPSSTPAPPASYQHETRQFQSHKIRNWRKRKKSTNDHSFVDFFPGGRGAEIKTGLTVLTTGLTVL